MPPKGDKKQAEIKLIPEVELYFKLHEGNEFVEKIKKLTHVLGDINFRVKAGHGLSLMELDNQHTSCAVGEYSSDFFDRMVVLRYHEQQKTYHVCVDECVFPINVPSLKRHLAMKKNDDKIVLRFGKDTRDRNPFWELCFTSDKRTQANSGVERYHMKVVNSVLNMNLAIPDMLEHRCVYAELRCDRFMALIRNLKKFGDTLTASAQPESLSFSVNTATQDTCQVVYAVGTEIDATLKSLEVKKAVKQTFRLEYLEKFAAAQEKGGYCTLGMHLDNKTGEDRPMAISFVSKKYADETVAIGHTTFYLNPITEDSDDSAPASSSSSSSASNSEASANATRKRKRT